MGRFAEVYCPSHSKPRAVQVSWNLEGNGLFNIRSLYQAIAASPTPKPLVQLWTIRLPLKISIFMWQWIRRRLPLGVEVLKRNGPGDGFCPLCDTEEDSNHIFFFSCDTAQFFWSCFREVLGGGWCYSNFPDIYEEFQASAHSSRHIRWLAIGVLAWTLWTIHNKLVIECAPLRWLSDTIYKLRGFLQPWNPRPD